MDDLSRFPDASFALVLGLGIYHQADSEAEWERAIAETARVLATDSVDVRTILVPPAGCPVLDQAFVTEIGSGRGHR